LQLHSGAAELDLSSASGATVAEVLAQVSPQAAQSIGHTVTVRDINPLQPGDPRGLANFYITLATVIVGFVSEPLPTWRSTWSAGVRRGVTSKG
jgi:hypothetical protein